MRCKEIHNNGPSDIGSKNLSQMITNSGYNLLNFCLVPFAIGLPK